MSRVNGDPSNLTVEELIIQLSAPEDRGPQEENVAAEGFLPIVVFANGPEHAYLVRTTQDDLDAALEAAQDRRSEAEQARLSFRRRLFDAMSQAIETDFAGPEALNKFPNDALLLFAEALAQNGVEEATDTPPCAVRFARDNLAEPDFENAPDEDEA